MGMAFQSIAASGQRPYFKTLIDENKVSNPEFSFYLGRTKSGTQGNSELTLGGSDSSKYTDTPTKIAVSTPGYWHIPLDGVSVNAIDTALDVTIDKGQAAIDTGTTIILAPSIASTDIFARIPGSIPIPLELIDGSIEPILYAYPCSSTPRVAITFGVKNFDISEFSNHTNLPPPFPPNQTPTYANSSASRSSRLQLWHPHSIFRHVFQQQYPDQPPWKGPVLL